MKTDDTLTSFVSLQDIKSLYREAEARFKRRKKIHAICRAHCRVYGGPWPRMTRRAKIRYFEAARQCRQWQRLYDHLNKRRSAAKLD